MTKFTAAGTLMLALLSTTAFTAAPAFAQEEEAAVEEVVITGTRAPGRTRLDSVSPVDVITSETLSRQGTGGELASSLAQQAPSINFPRPAISDGSDHIRPATLRGLAPDQTLVLINGLRGHIGSLVNVNGAIGRGSTAFDLNTIPTVSLSTVEVLRDGASAQYGADAIAGVINLRLREARSGGAITANIGRYDTAFMTSRSNLYGEREETDGLQKSIAGWVGLPLGEEGFLTISAELQEREPTNRSDYVNLAALPAGQTVYTPGTVLGNFGDPETKAATIWYNAGLPIGDGWEAYSFGGYQKREGLSGATARAYNNGNNLTAIYPRGFLPKIYTDSRDTSFYGGAKGELAGFTVDFSAGYGKNELDYETRDSLNPTYGAASQTDFNSGGFSYDQTIFGIDASKPYEVGMAEPLNVAFGAGYREESYEIHPGEPASYNRGTFTGTPGAQGFPGFTPQNAVSAKRHNYSAYVDLEGKLIEALSFGLAARYEDYSDFGDKVTGKVSARYDFNAAFALRAAISNGFKAPALQQQYFSYTATNLVTTSAGSTLIQSGKLRVNDPGAIALGAKPLEPETSTNFSAGVVLRTERFELTVDAYRIEMENRIALSENLGVSTPSQTPATILAIQALLAPTGVTAAQFFLNGVDSTTKGLDIVAHYRIPTDTMGRFDLTLAANLNSTRVTRVPATPSTTAVGATGDFLFDRGNRLSYEEGQPEEKLVAAVDWRLAGWGATLKATSYDSVLVPNNNSALDYQTGKAILLDAEARYEFENGISGAVGVNNLMDEYPNFTPGFINSPTGSVGFPQYSPFGFNGRFLYARVGYKW